MYKMADFAKTTVVSEFTVGDANSPFYYIFNFSGNEFVIVSADDAVYPVLAYSYETSYSPDHLSPEFSFWMNHYANEIKHVRSSGLQPDSRISEAWSGLLIKKTPGSGTDYLPLEVQPLISDTWHQYFPYNAMCPADSAGPYGHVPVGCVATAMSMIMHYWRYPDMGQGYHCDNAAAVYGPQCADFGATKYDWNSMNRSQLDESDAMALLSYHTGISIDMSYGTNTSSASFCNVSQALVTYFGYSPSVLYLNRYDYTASEWIALLKDDLDASRPIQYGGQGPYGGHGWICDGYQGTDFFHMNWGWNGSYNGYFYLNNLNPGTTTYNDDQIAILNIQPSPAHYPAYCPGADTVSNSTSGSIEDGSGPFANYLPGSNCSWLINADDSVKNVTLNFVRFATNVSDLVKIYDGSTTLSPLLATYSGHSLPADITSSGSAMLVTFNSGSGAGDQGFLAEYNSTLYDFCTETTFLTAASGNFTDGSSRFKYRNSGNCKWEIIPPNANSVTLNFSKFNTEPDKDSVIIYDNVSGDLLGVYSGNYTTMPAPVTASSGRMLVMFNTNNAIRGDGWDASYYATVGIQENDIRKQINIFPIPATDVLHVEIRGSGLKQQGEIKLLDLRSNVLLSRSFKNFTTDEKGSSPAGVVNANIDVSGFAPGMYFLRVSTSEDTWVKRIIIIRK